MAASAPSERIPLNTLAIPFGLAGLAQLWTVATNALDVPIAVGQAWWLLAGIAWVATVVVHARRGRWAEQSVREQLRHLTQGPLAALLPIGAMLLGAGLYRSNAAAGTALTVGAILVAAGLAAWMALQWVRADTSLESVNGGHYLPISAAGLVGALAAGSVGLRGLAIGCFAVGVVFWVVTSGVIWLRLVRYPRLPDELLPTMAILVAPPAIAAAAWSVITGRAPDGVFIALTVIAAAMVGVQVYLLPRYRTLSFSLGFWSFTFPSASVAALAVTWLRIERPVAWRGTTITLLVAVTALVAVVAVKSVLILVRRQRKFP